MQPLYLKTCIENVSVSQMNVLETSFNSYKHHSTQNYRVKSLKKFEIKNLLRIKNVAQILERIFIILVLKFVILQKKTLKYCLFCLFPWVFHKSWNSLTFQCFPESMNPFFFFAVYLHTLQLHNCNWRYRRW
jgi:hypothetical protein